MISNYFKVWKPIVVKREVEYGVVEDHKTEHTFFPFDDHSLEDAYRAWNDVRRAVVYDVKLRVAVLNPFAFPELERPAWLGVDIIGLTHRGKMPVRNGNQKLYEQEAAAYQEAAGAIDAAWLHAWQRVAPVGAGSGGCKLCGGPKYTWQEFCGASCSGRYEAGERLGS